MNTNHLLGQLLRILYEKTKRAKLNKVIKKTHHETKRTFCFRISLKIIYYYLNRSIFLVHIIIIKILHLVN
jgi:hypothetical protein